MGKFKAFLKRKNIEFSVQRYLIDAMSHMALGLFASLLVGTILNSLGTWLNIPFLSETVWPIAKSMMGPAIGVAVAYGLKAPPFVLFASAITGAAGDSLGGGPVGAFVAAVIGAEFGKAVSKETKVDLIVTPAVTILTGVLIGKFVGPGIAKFMTGLGQMIIYATTLQPFWMGILVSVLVGLALTESSFSKPITMRIPSFLCLTIKSLSWISIIPTATKTMAAIKTMKKGERKCIFTKPNAYISYPPVYKKCAL
jgi:uncharacterized membrane protein